MTCNEFARIARDAARGSGGQREAVAAHLETCPACMQLMEEERRLSEGLAALAASMESLAAPPGLERRLKKAFRQRHAAPARPVYRKWLPWAVPAMAALAAALIAVPDGTVLPLGGADPLTKLTARAPEQLAVPAQQPVLASAPKPVRRSRPAMLAASRRAAPPHPRPFADEGTAFVPVRFAEPLAEDEPVQVIRVSLPGSAVRRFGAFVPPELAVERVSADVVMGQDGIARAIRFVR